MLITNTKRQSDYAVIYHYWNDRTNSVWEDASIPILPAIATLRGCNQDIDVHVIDASLKPCNWGDFPKKLKFKIWRFSKLNYPVNPLRIENKEVSPVSIRLTAQPWDVAKVAAAIHNKFVMFNDSDIFRLRDPLPTNHDPHFFISLPWNQGYHYYDKTNPQVQEFLEVWRSHITVGLYNTILRSIMVKGAKRRYFTAETVFEYLNQRFDFPGLRLIYDNHENYWYSPEEPVINQNTKNIHFLSHKFEEAERAKYAIIFAELAQNVRRALSEEDIQLVFGKYLDDEGRYSIHQLKDFQRK